MRTLIWFAFFLLPIFLLPFFLLPSCVWAQSATIEATFDRWNYPFNTTPGARLSGSTFGAVSDPNFDDYDGQIIVGFDTASAGLPTSSIEVSSLSLHLTTASDNTFAYDPTADSLDSYSDPDSDFDSGRPVELYGVGFRNGFLFPAFGPAVPGPIAFEESEVFAFGNPAQEGIRNAFVTDGVVEGMGYRDVSNRVATGIEISPWAVGAIPELSPGDLVPLNTTMEFELDLSNPNVAAYVQRGLDSGGLFFTVASLHASTQGSQAGIPSFVLGDPNLSNADLAVAELRMDYQVVPEPATASLLLIGALGIISMRGRTAG